MIVARNTQSPSFCFSQVVVCGVADNSHQPRFEDAAAVRAQVPERRYERVLCKVFCGRVIAHHSQRHAEDGVLVHLNEPIEGVEVSFEAELDELLFVL